MLGVISKTESVGGGTRKGVEIRVSLIRHFIMSFTLFLRVSDHYPCRKCLSVRDDGISDALDNNDRQKVYSLDKTHSLHSHTHATAPWLCKQQSRLLSLFLFLPLSIPLIHTTLYGILLSRFRRIFFYLLLLLLQLFPPRYVFTIIFLFALSSHI